MGKRIIDYPTITSISADDFLLLANYNDEFGKRKFLASKLVPSGEDLIGDGSDWAIPMIESNAAVSWLNDEIVATWNGNWGAGGLNIYKKTKIPASAKKIKFKIRTGLNNERDTGNYRLCLGLRSSIASGWIFATSGDWLIKQEYPYTYEYSNIEGELDLSNIHSDAYLYIVCVMWNYTVTQLELF